MRRPRDSGDCGLRAQKMLFSCRQKLSPGGRASFQTLFHGVLQPTLGRSLEWLEFSIESPNPLAELDERLTTLLRQNFRQRAVRWDVLRRVLGLGLPIDGLGEKIGGGQRSCTGKRLFQLGL